MLSIIFLNGSSIQTLKYMCMAWHCSLVHEVIGFGFPTPCHSSPSSPAECLGEIPALESSLINKNDIKILPGKWEWTAAQPWPPLSSVLKTPLWSSDHYAALRERLLRPAPQLSMVTGGQFVTIYTTRQPPPPPEPPVQHLDDHNVIIDESGEGDEEQKVHVVCFHVIESG